MVHSSWTRCLHEDKKRASIVISLRFANIKTPIISYRLSDKQPKQVSMARFFKTFAEKKFIGNEKLQIMQVKKIHKRKTIKFRGPIAPCKNDCKNNCKEAGKNNTKSPVFQSSRKHKEHLHAKETLKYDIGVIVPEILKMWLDKQCDACEGCSYCNIQCTEDPKTSVKCQIMPARWALKVTQQDTCANRTMFRGNGLVTRNNGSVNHSEDL